MDNKNILLVYPKMPENTYWSFAHSLQFIDKKTAMPPLGLITIASMLKDYNLRLIDENVEPIKESDLQWADMMFTSSMIIQTESLNKVIKKAHEHNIPIIAGGPYPTQFYDKIQGVDYFILGEAETGVLEQFLNDLKQGKPKKAYARLNLRKNELGNNIDASEFTRMQEHFGEEGSIKLVEERPEMDLSPLPRYDLLKINAYGSMSIQLSRGCPHNCEFCNEPSLFGHKPRLKSEEKFIGELRIMHDDLGYKGSVFVVDDNFIGNIKKIKEILPKIEKFQKDRKYPFKFYTEASINLGEDEELMTAMRDAGFSMVFVGIESPEESVLEKAGKKINMKSNMIDSIRNIQKHGMEVTAGMIVGMDGEPHDIYEKIFNFSQEAGIPMVMAGLLVPMQGSELYLRFQKEGRILHSENDGNNTHFFDLAYIPDGKRNSKEIIKSYKMLLEKLYPPDGKNYFNRCKTLLENIVPGVRFVRKITFEEVKMFFRSLTKQTFQSYGWAYLKFLAHSLKNKKETFPEAIRLAIMGHHYITITKEAQKS